jgi:hypothetical protein
MLEWLFNSRCPWFSNEYEGAAPVTLQIDVEDHVSLWMKSKGLSLIAPFRT